jgi:hypothetical protein
VTPMSKLYQRQHRENLHSLFIDEGGHGETMGRDDGKEQTMTAVALEVVA